MNGTRPLAWRALAAAGSVAVALGLTASGATAANDWGQRVAGRHVYDLAQVLTPAQVTDLESSAAALDRAGAPTVVYLRLQAADDATTRLDARDLMDAWAVESAAGARDGVVLLLNLRPDDARHGSAALVAGAHHAGDGTLSDARLQTIYDGTMRPRLVAGDMAGAVSAALAEAAHDLAAPEPPAGGGSDAGTPLGLVLLSVGGVAALLLFGGILISRLGSGGGGGGGGGPRRRFDDGATDYGARSAGSSTYTGGDGGASSGSSSGGGSF